MTDIYREPASECSVEVKISKSLFIGHVRTCRNEDEFRRQLKKICDEHKQATHNCWAYRIGDTLHKEYFSDDGEPAGTAGKPILGSIARLDVTNTLVVVTRYFGGVKLGVRGLIEAYGSTASDVLQKSGVVERILKKSYIMSAPYDMIKTVRHIVSNANGAEEDLLFAYGEKVAVECSIPRSDAQYFEAVLDELVGTGRLYFWNLVNHD